MFRAVALLPQYALENPKAASRPAWLWTACLIWQDKAVGCVHEKATTTVLPSRFYVIVPFP